MKIKPFIKIIRFLAVTLLVVGVMGVHFKFSGGFGNSQKKLDHSGFLEANAPKDSLRQVIDQTCGACHINPHIRPAGDYSLNSGADARKMGAVATNRGVSPLAFTDVSTMTALIIQKPLEGSITPHGGIKIPESHPAIQGLIDFITREKLSGAQPDLDRPAPAALRYEPPLGANEHRIVYSRREFRKGGFKTLSPGGDTRGSLYVMEFEQLPGNPPTININSDQPMFSGTPLIDMQNPHVSLDGTKILFSGKANSGSRWEIYEANMDGSGLRLITSGSGHKVQPFYLPYLPDGTWARNGEGGIGYLTDAPGFRDEYNTTRTRSLFVCGPSQFPPERNYVCDTAGSSVRQIDFNPSHQIHPWMHSSGMLVFTRWEHNEHQRQNFMSLFAVTAADWESAGMNLFGAFGEAHMGGGGMGNSLHDSSEILGAGYGQISDMINPSQGMMVARRSSRDGEGGSIVGPFFPRLMDQARVAPVIAQGDDVDMGEPMDMMDISSVTYREARSLLNGLYVMSVATLTAVTPVFDEFLGTTEYQLTYGEWDLRTFSLTPGGTMHQLTPIHNPRITGFNMGEAVPVVAKPHPSKIGKPYDLNSNVGVFTSGNVTSRQSDGQPQGFSVQDVSVVRFVRALQLSQGSVRTGQRNDDGIGTQIIGEAPIFPDGSFSAEIPANVPVQFQLIDKNGRGLVFHKPWVQVMGGETMRCVGCHAVHNAPATVQTLEARQTGLNSQLAANQVRQYHFFDDIQPILNAKCVTCHDSALKNGAAGYNPNRPGSRALSLSARFTPGNVTESYESLTGTFMGEGMNMNGLVRNQNSRGSRAMWYLTGLKLNVTPPTPYPNNPGPLVAHDKMLTAEELDIFAQWIDTGALFRVVHDNRPSPLRQIGQTDRDQFEQVIWPFLENQCLTCHFREVDSEGNEISVGQGGLAMDLDGDPESAEMEGDIMEDRIAEVATRSNFMIPEASVILRKPLGHVKGGMDHVGGEHFTGLEDPNYLAIYNWIAAINPSLAPGPVVSDLINITNYPNPFRDTTNFVYRLTGNIANKVEVKIYSQTGKLIRELDGSTRIGGIAQGWNSVTWDGKDKNGDEVANDVYFYLIKAEYGDGTKKKFRGKCVKVK